MWRKILYSGFEMCFGPSTQCCWDPKTHLKSGFCLQAILKKKGMLLAFGTRVPARIRRPDQSFIEFAPRAPCNVCRELSFAARARANRFALLHRGLGGQGDSVNIFSLTDHRSQQPSQRFTCTCLEACGEVAHFLMLCGGFSYK